MGLADHVVLFSKTTYYENKRNIDCIGIMLITSCSDVLIEDYIAWTWELKAYLRNDVEETPDINISDYEESYVLAETYSRKYIDGKQQLLKETGKFDINEDDMSIHISDGSSIADFSDHHYIIYCPGVVNFLWRWISRSRW